jgi:hypothetical protein
MALRPVFISGVVYALLAGAAGAETIALTATLSGANEVPPVTSPGNGDAQVTVDTATREMRWEVRVEGLSAPLSAAHFHGPSTTAQNGGIVVPIAKKGDVSPFVGSATLDDEQLADLLDGRWYVNIHTPNHPPGEIRGQVVRK